MIKRSIYSAILEDNSLYVGGMEYTDTKWLDINKKIKRLFYRLPTGDTLCLVYDKYYHMVEATMDILGGDTNKVKYSKVSIMGKKEDKVVCWEIDLKTNEVKYKIYNENDKEITRLNKTFWR